MTERILKSIWLHPFRWMAGALLLIASIFVICSGNKESQPPLEKKREEVVNNTPAETNLLNNESLESRVKPDDPAAEPPQTEGPENDLRSDPIDGDESEADVAQGNKIAAERAALPFLPLKTKNVTAKYRDQLSNGDLVIEVSFRGSKAETIREWQKFLDKYQDPGTAYLVIYKPK
jgi:hypothetical protein